MSLCPMSWRKIRQLGHVHHKPFVHASSWPSGIIIAVDVHGQTWRIDRKASTCTSTAATTTARQIQVGIFNDENWENIIRQRTRELAMSHGIAVVPR